MRTQLFLILFLSCIVAKGQGEQSPYHPPLGTELRLAGNFGELRPGHFHTGLDLKTWGRRGLPIKSIEEGYISRIKIQEGGYGRTLYIDHPDGNTSVYAHLESFAPSIERFMRKVQYKHERGPIDLYPGEGILPVERGETVAYSGNSGSSSAPHLHFEIRNTASEKPIDPMLFGFDLFDRRAPVFNGLRVIMEEYDARSGSRIRNPSHLKEGRSRNRNRTYGIRRVGRNSFRLKQEDPIRAPEKIAFAVRTTDRSTGTHNPLGTRKIEVFIDGDPFFAFRLDTLDFSKKAFVDAHIDHPYLYRSGRNYHRCHLLPFNELPIYDRNLGNGWFDPQKGSVHQVRMVASDRAGNRSVLRFKIKGTSDEWLLKSHMKRHVEWKESAYFEREGIELEFSPKSIYHDLSLQYDPLGHIDPYSLSKTHKVHTPATPLHKPYTARIELDTLPPGSRDKLFILNEDERWSSRVYEARYDSGYAVGKVGRFGTLSVRADSTPPEIRPIRVRNVIPRAEKEEFRFLVEDNLSGIATYEARIDGKWRIPYYDPKNDLIIVDVSDPLRPLKKGKRKFRFEVSDRAGNTSTFTKKIKVR